MSKSVRILFPSLTHSGKIYDYGEIEKEPTPWLVEAAKNKLTMFHRDAGREIRVAKFVDEGDDVALNPADAELVKMLTVDDLIVDLDLQDKMKPELAKMASELGLKERSAKELDKDRLKRFVTFMRKL